MKHTHWFKTALSFSLYLFVLTLPVVAAPLSLDVFVKDALAQHPSSRLNRQTYLKNLRATMANTAIHDWNVFVNASQTNGLSAYGNYESAGRYRRINTGVSKIFSHTGTRFQTRVQYDASTDQPAIGALTFPDSYNYDLSLTLTQPLLKNAFGKIDRYPLILKEQQDKITDTLFKEDQENFVGLLISEYITWQTLFSELNVLTIQLGKAKKQLEISTQQYKRGTVEESDVVLAKQDLLTKEISLESLTQAYLTQGREIAILRTGLPQKNNLDISPDIQSTLSNPPTRSKALSIVINHSAIHTLLNSELEIEQAILAKELNETHAQLDAFVTQSLASTGSNNSDARNDVGDNKPLTLGIVYTKSIQNTKEISEAQSREASLEAFLEKQAITRLELNLTINSLYDKIESLDTRINQSIRLKALGEVSTRLEEEKYTQGRRQSYQFVLGAQNQLLSTRIAIERLKYQKEALINQIHLLVDTYTRTYSLGLAKHD
jgi:outer membrane protein TolC